MQSITKIYPTAVEESINTAQYCTSNLLMGNWLIEVFEKQKLLNTRSFGANCQIITAF